MQNIFKSLFLQKKDLTDFVSKKDNFAARERIIIFLMLFVGGIILSGLLAVIPTLVSGNSLGDLADSEKLNNISSGFLRLQLFLSHLGMFLIPSFVYGLYVFGKDRFWAGFDLSKMPKFTNIVLAFLFLVACYPLVNAIHFINAQIPLADWMIGAEQNVKEMLTKILSSDNRIILVLNILLVSVMPAIGEELVFRGILQKNISSLTKNGHIGIWVAAFLFSAIHMQFEGFLARMVLGAILGYTYYFTGNLWIPILVHFINNLIPIIYFMVLETDITDTTNLKDNMNWYSLIITIIGLPGLIYLFLKTNKNPEEAYA